MKSEVCRPARIITGVVLLGAASVLLCSASSVTTFYDYSAFEDALAPGTQSTTESFAGNQIQTPGLSVSGCYSPGYGGYSCRQFSAAQLNTQTQFEYITQNMFTDAVGRYPDNPYSGGFGNGDFVTVFTLPKYVTAVGFDVSTNPNQGAAFGIDLAGGTQFPFVNVVSVSDPFGGIAYPGDPNDPDPGTPNGEGYAYTGFIGFTSDTPFDLIEISACCNPSTGVNYTMDNLTFGDPVPEPATIGLAGLAILGLAVTKRQWSGKKR
jgi:hypothetical protein